MATNEKLTRTQKELSDQRLIDGLRKYEQILPSVVIGGVVLKTADLIAMLQARIDSGKNAVQTRAIWLAAVDSDRGARMKTQPTVAGLRQALLVAFNHSLEALADFGLAARKPSVASPEVKVAAIAKAQATRKARHTLGPRQRKAIKGVVPEAVRATGSSS